MSARIRIEGSSADLPLRGCDPFAGGHNADSTVLVRGDHAVGSEVTVSAADCLELPQSLECPLALLVPPLAWTLALWATLELELGDAAVFTEAGPLSTLVGQVASWWGACPVVEM